MSPVAPYGKLALIINFIASSWNMLITEMYSKKYATIKRERHTSKRRRFGMYSFRLLEALKLFMIAKFCTEI